MKLPKVVVLMVIFASVQCLAEETTLPPEEITTTEEPTTTELPSNESTPLQEIDFRMTSTVGNFFVDINFTEIRGDSNSVNMIVKVNALPKSEPSRYICKKLLGIYLLNLPNCEGLDISVWQPARLLSQLNKEAGEESLKVSDLSIDSLLSMNCLIVAADNSSFNQIFTTTTTSTSTVEPTTTAPDETTFLSIAATDVIPSSLREMARKLRQLGLKKSGSNIKVGHLPYMKHQYDVKKVAQEVDGGESQQETDIEVKESYPEDLGPDYYDPDDLTDDENLKLEELENDISIANLLGVGNPGVEDDFFSDQRYGFDKQTVQDFRSGGCPAGKVSDQVSLLESLPQVQTRAFVLTSFAIVLSSGSVSTGSTAIVNSNTPSVIFFGNVGSFTFNPFANWPVVTLQGFYVLATYGVIIIWALVLGAIVWGVSIGRFSDLFSARKVGYVASELIYRPIERLTTAVHSGIERFSHLNRRISRKKSPRRPSPYYHRINEFDYEDNYFYDYEEEWQNH